MGIGLWLLTATARQQWLDGSGCTYARTPQPLPRNTTRSLPLPPTNQPSYQPGQVGCSEIVGRIVEDLKDESEPYRCASLHHSVVLFSVLYGNGL